MKKIYLFSLLILICLIGCSKKTNTIAKKHKSYQYFKVTTWVSEKYGFKQIIKDDSLFISGTLYDGSIIDTVYHFSLTDSTLYYTEIKEDTTITVSYGYDFIFYYDMPYFVLSTPSSYFLVFTPEKRDIEIKSTNNSKSIRFEIDGYSIGDIIDRDLINFTDVSNYGVPLEIGNLRSNNDIILSIIGDSIIYSIERENIHDYDIDNILKVVTNKLGKEPEHDPMPNKKAIKHEPIFERYSWWNSGAVSITLSRGKYVDYFGDVRTINWGLEYDDKLKQSLMEIVYGDKPKSSIIK
ncbi:MAG: hypothetical protein H8D22_09025 [Candidatus Cloacimonetes bacterium]|nr:hypothetical protein [Candidatus Cloacimonadota bacterium]